MGISRFTAALGVLSLFLAVVHGDPPNPRYSDPLERKDLDFKCYEDCDSSHDILHCTIHREGYCMMKMFFVCKRAQWNRCEWYVLHVDCNARPQGMREICEEAMALRNSSSGHLVRNSDDSLRDVIMIPAGSGKKTKMEMRGNDLPMDANDFDEPMVIENGKIRGVSGKATVGEKGKGPHSGWLKGPGPAKDGDRFQSGAIITGGNEDVDINGGHGDHDDLPNDSPIIAGGNEDIDVNGGHADQEDPHLVGGNEDILAHHINGHSGRGGLSRYPTRITPGGYDDMGYYYPHRGHSGHGDLPQYPMASDFQFYSDLHELANILAYPGKEEAVPYQPLGEEVKGPDDWLSQEYDRPHRPTYSQSGHYIYVQDKMPQTGYRPGKVVSMDPRPNPRPPSDFLPGYGVQDPMQHRW